MNDIKKVSEELKSTLLNAEYFINLTITDMVDNKGEYIPTGMKWNE